MVMKFPITKMQKETQENSQKKQYTVDTLVPICLYNYNLLPLLYSSNTADLATFTIP